MPNINIKIRNKVAKGEYAVIVCDNSDYTAHFDFDAEWDAYTTKTARFVYGGKYTDVVFSGSECPVPVMQDTRAVTVGVFAGDLHTTTPAYFACVPSILFGNGIPADPTPEVYAQIMELLNKESSIWYPAVDDAGNMSWTRSIYETEPQPVNIKGPKGDAGADGVDGNDGVSPAVSVAAITGGNRVTITDADGAKTFDVMDGAQGASGADGKDYVLTNTDKQEIAKTAAGLVDVPSVQPDWNQNDSTQPDYVKNRPFYTGNPVETVLVEESTVSFANQGGRYMAQFPSTFAATVGETYKVNWDGTLYERTCADHYGNPVIGNLSIIGAGSDTGEPFLMLIFNGEGIQIVTADTSASHTISISVFTDRIVKIDAKYIPEQYMDKSNPTGTGSFSLNRKADSTVGEFSFAEGHKTTASGYASHAEGDYTTASGIASHAEGNGPTASGESSHAEGTNTTASGDYSHAEGHETTASGIASHAEGYGTKASSKYQHVHGKYNIEDKSNTYAEIVGNGEQLENSNAHTLDWSGNAWYAGTVEGKALILPSSTPGSTKKFKITVDDSGVITATEVT